MPNRTGEYRGNNKQSHRHWVALKSTGHPSPSRVTAAARANATKANAVASVHVFAENDVFKSPRGPKLYNMYDAVFSQERYRETDLQLCHYAELFRRRGTEIFVYELFR